MTIKTNLSGVLLTRRGNRRRFTTRSGAEYVADRVGGVVVAGGGLSAGSYFVYVGRSDIESILRS